MSQETRRTEPVSEAVLLYRRLMAEQGCTVQPDTSEQERKDAERKEAIEKAKQEARASGRYHF